MNDKERAVMQQALEALEAEFYDDVKQSKLSKAITALRKALDHFRGVTKKVVEQAEQEPVAWMVYTADGQSVYVTENPTDIKIGQRALPLYTAAQPDMKLSCKSVQARLATSWGYVKAEQAEQEPAGIVWDASAPVVMDSAAPKNENQEVAELRKQVAALKAVVDAWKNVEQEPVAWVDLEQWQSGEYDCFTSEKVADYMTPLYAAPVRTKDLTDDEIWDALTSIGFGTSCYEDARAVIAADREKNNVK